MDDLRGSNAITPVVLLLAWLLYCLVYISSAAVATELRESSNYSENLIKTSNGAVFEEFRGLGDATFTDERGQTFQIFFPSSRPHLQDIIDSVSIDLMSTSIGSLICSQVLNSDPSLIENHLSVSTKAANQIARECSSIHSDLQGPVYASPPDVIRKLSLRPSGDRKRLYILVVTDAPYFPFDSWTDPLFNNTILVVRNSPQLSEFNYSLLSQLLAHELAIYFDSRSWPGTKEWSNVPTNRFLETFFRKDLRPLNTILSNPLIGTVFAFMRAFSIESNMITELANRKRISLNPSVEYNNIDFPFLSSECTPEERINYVKKHAESLLPFSLPLLAWSPHYRSRKLSDLIDSVPGSKNQSTKAANLVLTSLAPKYLESSMQSSFLNQLLDLPDDFSHSSPWLKTERVFASLFFPNEFSFLRQTAIKHLSSNYDVDLDVFKFMSEPALSGYNVRMSSGPRPRIRGGGFLLQSEFLVKWAYEGN
ncbi:MAG: hypothetical protein KDD35_06415 [Bdellovibrionales bacterium]|nr:hypothetical protein [Bdellovibrionales bacterium]